MNRRMQKKKDKKITEAINGLVFIAERREQQRQAAIQQFVKRCEQVLVIQAQYHFVRGFL